MRVSLWDKTLLEVEQLKDALGRGLDPGSRELVACLRMIGLNTVMSCEGHPDRQTEGPYVMFRSAEALSMEAQYWMLARDSKRKSGEARELRKVAYELNMRERQKITPLLERFYEHRFVQYGDRIIITTFDLGGSRLKCQAAEEFRLADNRESFLRSHWQEFADFTLFLKHSLQV